MWPRAIKDEIFRQPVGMATPPMHSTGIGTATGTAAREGPGHGVQRMQQGARIAAVAVSALRWRPTVSAYPRDPLRLLRYQRTSVPDGKFSTRPTSS